MLDMTVLGIQSNALNISAYRRIQPRVCLSCLTCEIPCISDVSVSNSCLAYELPRINMLQVKIVNQNVHGFGGQLVVGFDKLYGVQYSVKKM